MMNNTIEFPTIDAIDFSRMMARNAMNMNIGMWRYSQTELNVPRVLVAIRLQQMI